MKIRSLFVSIILFAFMLAAPVLAQAHKSKYEKKGYRLEEFSHKDLTKWASYGKGAIEANHGQTVMYETPGSLGYMLVSPDSYQGDIIVEYDVMTLNAATVLIVEMFAHSSDDYKLELEPEYDGNVKYLFNNIRMYMFAFHNTAHNKTGPFVRKYPQPGMEALISANRNVMNVGKVHHVEMAIQKDNLWFKLDGKKLLNVHDDDPFRGGKVILRIRGTAHETASCIIKNLKIYKSDQ